MFLKCDIRLIRLYSLGFNDNPTAQQFEAAYRKLLVHNDVVCSKKSNVIEPGTKILSVSSNRNRPLVKKTVPLHDEGFDEFFMGEDFENSFHVAQYVDDAHSHSLAYMASILEAKIIGGKRRIIKCDDCVSVFIENELLEDSFIRFKARSSNVLQPCRSKFEICKFVDSYVKSCEEKSTSYQSVLMEILRKISFESLYTASDFSKHAEKGHKYDFVKKIVELFMHMKSVHIAKGFTLKIHENPIRHTFRKLIHEQGQ